MPISTSRQSTRIRTSRSDMTPLTTLLDATRQMRAQYPTERERAAWDAELDGMTLATVLGAVASLIAYPSRDPIVIPEYQPPCALRHDV